jgi:hypothetical protein
MTGYGGSTDMSETIDDGGEFLRQAAICRAMNSPFSASVLEAGIRQLACGPQTARLVAEWPGDRGAAAVALRFNGGIHALARARATPGLVRLFADLRGDFDAVIGEALAAEDAFMARWMEGVPQTNEVARASAIVAGLLVVARQFDLPFELLELGSSGGLNLNLARYAYKLGGTLTGDPTSAVRMNPEWRGPKPPAAVLKVHSARGVDMSPLDLNDPTAAGRLLSFVWADQPERAERLEAAIDIARAYPPRIDRGDALEWIAARLSEPQEAGVCRAIFHSIVLQYLSPEGRAAVKAAIADAGARATAARPLAWVSFEWDMKRSNVRLGLTMWPGGEVRDLATCHAHAAWVEWHA